MIVKMVMVPALLILLNFPASSKRNHTSRIFDRIILAYLTILLTAWEHISHSQSGHSLLYL